MKLKEMKEMFFEVFKCKTENDKRLMRMQIPGLLMLGDRIFDFPSDWSKYFEEKEGGR